MVNPEKPAPRKRRKPAPLLSAGGNGSESSGDPALDDARRKKIADIKKALDEGTYRVSNEDVAAKLIQHMLQPKK